MEMVLFVKLKILFRGEMLDLKLIIYGHLTCRSSAEEGGNRSDGSADSFC